MIKKLKPDFIFCSLFYAAVFVFFGIIYKYHLFFQEQQQLFQLTWNYFIQSVKLPGGFIGYLGEFLTQFYYIPIIGSAIITFFLFLVQQFTAGIINLVKKNEIYYPLTFIPSLFYGLLLCNDFYYLAGLIGFAISLSLTFVYIHIQNNILRFVAGILLVSFIYYTCGGAFVVFITVATVWEILKLYDKKIKPVFIISILVYIIIGAVFPLIIRYFFVNTILQAFLSSSYYKIPVLLPVALVMLVVCFPVLMFLFRFLKVQEIQSSKTYLIFGLQIVVIFSIAFYTVKSSAFLSDDDFVTYDYYARKGEWQKIVDMAKENNPKDQLSLVYLNLALSKTGQLGNTLFHFKQNGGAGLFITDDNNNYQPFLVGNEVYYHLGLVNLSQYFAFEGMETAPDHKKNVRCIKRLAETNLINANYEVAKKYLLILDKTLFYIKWAKETMTFLNNEEKINAHPEWGLMRNLKPKSQYFFTYDQVDVILRISLRDNPKNLQAFEYLMSYYLLNKDLKSFKTFYILGQEAIKAVPLSFQEAILYIISLKADINKGNVPAYIFPVLIGRLNLYASIYTSNPNPISQLQKDFFNTYWFYFHFH